jgi:alpha-tubulin suppressor-like RCC1 family protein
MVAALGCREDAQSPTGPEPEPALDITPAQALSFRQVTAGAGHTCGVTIDDRAFCWGSNFYGQLGNGTADNDAHPRPVAVAGGLRFLLVDAGTTHTCGVTTDNWAYCWGDNSRGALGIGTSTGPEVCLAETPCSTGPVAVARGRRFRQVSAGTWYSCGVKKNGRAFCWGSNSEGKLGDGTDTDRLLPARVVGGLRFRQVAAGDDHTCGVTIDDRAFCWGSNSTGQLGGGTDFIEVGLQPVPVAGGLLFRQVRLGIGHSCGATTDNHAYCWGRNDDGQLGIGTAEFGPHPRPLQVVGGLEFRRVTAANRSTCGVTTDYRAYCWGLNNGGSLGDGTTTERLQPVPVAGGRRFRQLDMSGAHTCGVNPFDRAFCWGDNAAGQLGDGTTTQRLTPVRVVGPT